MSDTEYESDNIDLEEITSKEVELTNSRGRVEIIEYPEEPTNNRNNSRSCGGNWFEMFIECCCCPCLGFIYCSKAIFNFIQRSIFYFMAASRACIQKINENNAKKDLNADITALQVFETCYYVTFELYKVVISSFLIIFTQQKCIANNEMVTTCTMIENFYPDNTLETIALATNFSMFGIFIVQYIFEIMREFYLIKYLSFDQNIPNNDKKITYDRDNANEKIFKRLDLLYILYIKISFAVLFVYLFNICVSSAVVYYNYLNKSSIIGFVTNSLFVVIKIISIINITTDGNAYYSAYKRLNIHYNIIKPKYLTNNNS
jgi:hypothetical protein